MIATRRTAFCAAAIAIAALVAPRGVVELAIVALAIAVIVDAVYARKPISLTRAVAPILIIGQPSPLRLQATSATSLANVRVRQPRNADLRIEPGETNGTLEAEITALRRGRHALPTAVARRQGPLRLAAWDFQGEGSNSITVYPDVPAARRIAQAVRTHSFLDAGEIRRGPLGLGTEFESIREYQPDDDVRQVNWLATNRVGRPMSNQYRVETERQVICMIDCGRLMAAPVGDKTRLDIAIDAITAVAHVSDVLGDRCGTVAFEQTVIRNLADRRRGAAALVHAIHDLQPSERDSDYDLAFRTVRNTKRALIIVMTDLLDEAAARSLIEAVPVLARRHAVIVASVVDPDVSAALSQPPADDHGIFRIVAALDVSDARSRVRQRLHAAGAVVVEAPESSMSAATVAAYLRLKDSARV